MKAILIFLTTASIAGSAWAQCLTPQLSPEGPLDPDVSQRLEFETVDGADQYQIEILHPHSRSWYVLGTTGHNGFELPAMRFPFEDELRIRVVAEAGPVTNTTELCSGDLTVKVQVDPELRRDLARAVIPVAGSTEGAFGSQWRTIMSLANIMNRPMSGTIIFHPAGAIASDQDPSMSYQLDPGEVEQWPDVVTAMGATGLGTIDIIPDEVSPLGPSALGGYFPTIQVRVVNDSDAGTFGTNVREVFVSDLAPRQLSFYTATHVSAAELAWGARSEIIIPADYEHLRINVGFRYFGFEDLFNIYTYDPQDTPFVQMAIQRNGELIETVWREAPAGFMEQVPLEEVFEGEIQEGDVILVRSISALTYWSVTDNRTNDPSFFFNIHNGDVRRVSFE